MSNPNKIKAGNLHQPAPETAPPTAPRLNRLKARLDSWIDNTRDMPINQVVQELLRDCKSALEEQEENLREVATLYQMAIDERATFAKALSQRDEQLRQSDAVARSNIEQRRQLEAQLQQCAEKLADAFAAWPLPETVCCDRCALEPGYPHRSGTNLLTISEAREMFKHVLSKCGMNT